MSSLYQKRGYYYFSVKLKGKRITRSLGTKSKRIANKLRPVVEYEILKELHSSTKQVYIPFYKLVKVYLESNPHWKKTTLKINKYTLNHFLNRGLPTNPTSRAMVVQRVNLCINWAKKNRYKTDQDKLMGDIKGDARTRVFDNKELKLLLNNSQPKLFRDFIAFAYYTGARRGEIAQISKDNLQDGKLYVTGKTGAKILKITDQASRYFNEYDYNPDFISHHFKKELRRLGIKNGRFHDLRRTFGYNLIIQGMPIYEVSKLLGHSSVKVTEIHYAPLMVTEIREFKL